MALKKNFRFSIIMTKQVLVRVRCWLETTTSSVDTVYCAQVRPSSCSTANVDSAPAHVICIVSSLHTAQLCWLPGTHTLTRVLAFTQIAHILGWENVPCPSYLVPTIRNWYGTILTARQMKCQFNVYYLDASPWSINWLHYQFSFIIRYSSKSDEEVCGRYPHHHTNPLSHRHSSTFSLILPCFLCFPHILLTSQRS